eukprot:CAMPEP_0119328360 /NCGR_PEP_ID=MMETSP1333-20130426/73133_1 /TAXON_ID=418940 /ORGANISM="Scyphosphaera apsteinii, Strain RCC1455" /LENGTH=304 /DNA_ID=CAMNT_0007337185 /DNA_START=242 /DNA_END=1152 /DNA_ORIENTATION=+
MSSVHTEYRLIVKDLPQEARTQRDLLVHFSRFGNVAHVNIPVGRNREGFLGPQPFAFVSYKLGSELDKALGAVHVLCGTTLTVLRYQPPGSAHESNPTSMSSAVHCDIQLRGNELRRPRQVMAHGLPRALEADVNKMQAAVFNGTAGSMRRNLEQASHCNSLRIHFPPDGAQPNTVGAKLRATGTTAQLEQLVCLLLRICDSEGAGGRVYGMEWRNWLVEYEQQPPLELRDEGDGVARLDMRTHMPAGFAPSVGDWQCGECGNWNFRDKEQCNNWKCRALIASSSRRALASRSTRPAPFAPLAA